MGFIGESDNWPHFTYNLETILEFSRTEMTIMRFLKRLRVPGTFLDGCCGFFTSPATVKRDLQDLVDKKIVSPRGGGVFMMILGLVLIAALVYFVLKKGNSHSGMALETPLDILKKRYVNGEISEEEYLQKVSILKKS